jgi:hypothetical protein
MQESAGAQKDLMTPLHTHRKVLGVIGICHGAAMQDIKHAYESFGKSCRCMLQGPGCKNCSKDHACPAPCLAVCMSDVFRRS